MPNGVRKKLTISQNRIILISKAKNRNIYDKNGESKYEGPRCVVFGLNYSIVYDKNQKVMSDALFEKSGIKAQPLIYNLSQKTLQNALLVNN